MSFERTKNSIDNLSNMEAITLDLLFDMMVCVSQDVMNYNKTTELSNTPVADQEMLLKKIYNLMQMTLSVYIKNRDGLSEFSVAIQERYVKLVGDMNAILSEVEEINVQIERTETKNAELQTKHTELLKTRGHLLTVSQECEVLQHQIDSLSDSTLDEKAKEKKVLEAELLERKSTEKTLEEQKCELRSKIDETLKRIETIKSDITMFKDEEKKLENEEDELLLEKTGLEKGIQNLEQKLGEYKAWIDDYPAMSEKIRIEHDEEKAKITSMVNALNGVMSEAFLKENLFKTLDASDKFVVENYPDCVVAETQFDNIQELQQWFCDMDNRINGLIKVYGTMLRTLINQAEKLTKG